MLTRISHTDCLLRSRPLRACIFVFRSLLSGIPGGGGPTELRVFNSVGRRSFFGAARIPSTLCNKRTSSADRIEDPQRSEEHTSELQSRVDLVCRLLLEKKNHTRQKLSK